MMRFCLFLYLTFAAAYSGFANDADSVRSKRWYVPAYIPVQFAGNIGLLSTGAGFSSQTGHYQLELLYGYAPGSVVGVGIQTIALKNHFPLGGYPINSSHVLSPYVGLGLSCEVSGHAFFNQPSRFPENYYKFPKNLHVLVYGGVRLQRLFHRDSRCFRGLTFFAEAGTIDVYLWYKTMTDQITFSEVFSAAVGVDLLLVR